MTKTPLDFWTTWTSELAYGLGFAFADGGIGKDRNSLTLAQAQTDNDISWYSIVALKFNMYFNQIPLRLVYHFL